MEPISQFLVKKYVIKGENKTILRWIVVGTEGDYLVSENYCSCYSFIQKHLRIGDECKHIQLLTAAQKCNEYDEFTISFEEYEILRREWLF